MLLAAGALALQWLDYRWLARTRSTDVHPVLLARAFLGLGVALGQRIGARGRRGRSTATPQRGRR